MNPFFEMKTFEYGYSLSHPREAVQAAREVAQHIVVDMNREGQKTRDWGRNLHSKIEDFLITAQSDFERNHFAGENLKRSLLDSVLTFEEDIKETVRAYFFTVSENMGRMKKLNPPLTNQELEPFVRSLNEDRRLTVISLDLLRLGIGKLQTFKTRLISPRAA